MFASTINRILSHLGFAIVRTETLHRLVAFPSKVPVSVEPIPQLDSLLLGEEQRFKELLRHQISTKWSIIDAFERRFPHVETLSCPLCGFRSEAGDFSTYETYCIFGGGELLRHQCPECDLIFGAPKMLSVSEAELSQDYEWHYKVFSEGDSTQQEIRAFHALTPTKEGVYLNWGAGAWSRSIETLRQEGWNVYGYEPHGSASSGGQHILSTPAQLQEMRFDGIFSNNVLEHLRHPVRELASMRDMLKPGGKMSHATPCFDYLYEFTRFHLFFFVGRSRTVLAKQAKLHIKEYLADGEFMNLILSLD